MNHTGQRRQSSLNAGARSGRARSSCGSCLAQPVRLQVLGQRTQRGPATGPAPGRRVIARPATFDPTDSRFIPLAVVLEAVDAAVKQALYEWITHLSAP